MGIAHEQRSASLDEPTHIIHVDVGAVTSVQIQHDLVTFTCMKCFPLIVCCVTPRCGVLPPWAVSPIAQVYP